MSPNQAIMQAVESLDYRVTIGDVVTQTGLNIGLASQGLLALASDVGGHMQVTESGDVVYEFPRKFRDILYSKDLSFQLQEWSRRIWKVLFYMIRIFFGILLIVSIVLTYVAIFIITTSSKSDQDNDNRSGNFSGSFIYFSDLLWYLSPNYGVYKQGGSREKNELNFLEAVFSFLFGDGDPNVNLEERRWQEVADVIRNNSGAVIAEQISPYLDDICSGYSPEDEDYMLPVLVRFNGQPKVSDTGDIIYYFPELQISASQKHHDSVSDYLQEFSWRFSKATPGQLMLSAGLGLANFVGILIIGGLLKDIRFTTEVGGLVSFVQGIYWILWTYGTGFLVIPLIRYFWTQWCNTKISYRNQQRQARSSLLARNNSKLQQKIEYAGQFTNEKVISKDDSVYSTSTDLIIQEIDSSARIETEWQHQLKERGD